ncbi:tetratricopeptide repeat protein [Flavobacterium selenitireducens]|uniref:tetratricopeptide repeat protein n=1 Tax=Flavobacterium selenitireducens TaxID=2722704 RepID=UPI00168B611D|nr:tetratricopeptide repeat protein [Flavobacterium selenitireducens]MBD3583926.1 tetratricopeptide repeat protein [Flavobacterium selenitireducens]
MNLRTIFILAFVIVFSACNLKGQQPDNTKPMYGETPKSAELQDIDNDFRTECLKRYKSIDSAVNVHIDLAWRHFYHNELETAMKRFNQAWLLNPEFPDSYFGFASLLDLQKNTAEAKKFYKMGKAKDATGERAKICYQRIADCKEQLQDFRGTVDAYRQLSQLNPKDAFAFKKLGYFQMELGDFKNAQIHYSNAIALDPSDPVTYNNRGNLFQRQQNHDAAIADFTKAIALDSKYIGAYVNRGTTEMETGNFIEAKRDFENSVELDSGSGELRRLLAVAKLSLHDKTGACNDLVFAKRLGDAKADEIFSRTCQ